MNTLKYFPKRLLTFFLLLAVPVFGWCQQIITDDVYNFWAAYDSITKESDSARQLQLINSMYIEKGSPGLGGIMRARRYTAPEYVSAIKRYPKFWTSIRKNTLQATQYSAQIGEGIEKLQQLYPALQPVNIYFTVGLLRTGGTTIDKMLLIGSEIALADSSIVTDEFSDRYPHLKNFFSTNPKKDVVFLNIHEYIHTQQKETIGKTLLAQTVMEGVAEFLAEVALNVPSPNPQIAFGYSNEEQIKKAFAEEMFSPSIYNWIMNNSNNQFGMRDLGYFVGYAICEKYYEASDSKTDAVRKMIELDYNDEAALIHFVEHSRYFDKPLQFYKAAFEKKRPFVISLQQEENNSIDAAPGAKTFTIVFSEEMNPAFTNFEYGPLGEENLLRITKVIGFSADKRSFSFEASVKPGKRYQLLVNHGFRSKDNYPLAPYLVDFSTTE